MQIVGAVVEILAGLSTVAVAIWGYGAWRLYKLEIERNLVGRGRTVGGIAALERTAHALAGTLSWGAEAGMSAASLHNGLEVALERIVGLRSDLEISIRSTTALPMAVFAYLETARKALVPAEMHIRDGLSTHAEQEIRHLTDLAVGWIARAERALNASYLATPTEDRSWGESGQSYDDLLSESGQRILKSEQPDHPSV